MPLDEYADTKFCGTTEVELDEIIYRRVYGPGSHFRLKRYAEQIYAFIERHKVGVYGDKPSIVAFDGNQVVGVSVGKIDRDDGDGDWEHTIFVLDSHRRRGIATAMTAYMSDYCGSRDWRLWMEAYTDEGAVFCEGLWRMVGRCLFTDPILRQYAESYPGALCSGIAEYHLSRLSEPEPVLLT